MNSKITFLLLVILAVTAAASQSPYQGEQLRKIKTLSEAEISGLLSGLGMGFAKAAELNHFPGPKHVLDLADELNLTADQFSETTIIFRRMRTEAIRIGKKLVDGEEKLDKLFENGNVPPRELDEQLLAIGETRAQLRGIHLKAHLAQRIVLTEYQLHKYDILRGYSSGNMDHSHSKASHR